MKPLGRLLWGLLRCAAQLVVFAGCVGMVVQGIQAIFGMLNIPLTVLVVGVSVSIGILLSAFGVRVEVG